MKHLLKLLSTGILVFVILPMNKLYSAAPPAFATSPRLSSMWNLDLLYSPPKTWPVPEALLPEVKIPEGTITPLFFEGVLFHGKTTRVFAWIGAPSGATKPHSLPGIILVHGGGGTAFRDWVRLWLKRGYVAIAMDTGGNIPLSPSGMTPQVRRHEWAGPASADHFANALKPAEDQWPYHAVAAIIRAHSLLRSLPGVDPERTGITGISWGGVWTEVAAGLDSQFKFAAPIYGCGFLGEDSSWKDEIMPHLPSEKIARWLELWDPSQYLPAVKMPVLFVNGTNDVHFRTSVWQKTTRLPNGPVTQTLKVRMPHGHPPAGDPKEVSVFADSILRQGIPLDRVHPVDMSKSHASITWTGSVPLTKAELVYTLDTGPWPKRRWESRTIPQISEKITAEIPVGSTAYYFNLHDERDCIISSELWIERTE